MSLQAAFIFLAPEVDANKHRAVVRTPQVDLTVVGVTDYAEAERVAKSLVSQGITAIELCGGFGVAGAARIARAVEGARPPLASSASTDIPVLAARVATPFLLDSFPPVLPTYSG
jgi:hypothetical protein